LIEIVCARPNYEADATGARLHPLAFLARMHTNAEAPRDLREREMAGTQGAHFLDSSIYLPANLLTALMPTLPHLHRLTCWLSGN
jgi:hypothetical protein